VDAATHYLATLRAHPYGLPYAPTDGQFAWGSNNLVLNNMVVLASAFDLTGDTTFRNGVLEGMDYILGRNALNQSYVTGYGEKATQNQHTRLFAHELNAALPHPPVGTMAGGPNSSIQDPLAAKLLKGCKAQFCYIDDIQSYSTNELAINWNSTLAWVASFVADQGDGVAAPPTGLKISYDKRLDLGGVFVSQVTVTNTGNRTVNGWTARWAFIGAQRVKVAVGAAVTQTGASAEAESAAFNANLRPGQSATFLFLGTTDWGANWTPVVAATGRT
jgi:endoglucanase